MKKHLAFLIGAAMIACTTSAFGQTALWTGTTGDWTDVGNWSIDPATAAAWYIDNGGTAEITTDVVLPDGLFGVGDYLSTSDGALVVKTGGSFTSGVTTAVTFGKEGHTGSLTIESGASGSFANRLNIGEDSDNPTGSAVPGIGNLTIADGASLTVGETLFLGRNVGASNFTMNGGTLNIGYAFAVGAGYSRINSSLYGGLALPANVDFTMTGGTITCEYLGWNSTSQVNMSGGSMFGTSNEFSIYTPDAFMSGDAYVSNTNNINIGKYGLDTLAHLTMSDTASVETGGTLYLYQGAGVTLSGDATMKADGRVYVYTSASVNLSGNASIESLDNFQVYAGDGATVSENSTLKTAGNLLFYDGSHANVSGTATMEATGTTYIYSGADATISGDGTMQSGSSVIIYSNTNTAISGNGTMQAGNTISITGDASIGDNGTMQAGVVQLNPGAGFSISGGTLQADVTSTTSSIVLNNTVGSNTQRSGAVTFNQTGGNVETASAIFLGANDYTEANYTISDGKLAINQAGLDTTNAAMQNQAGNIWMGHKPGSKGTLIQSGGTVLGCTTQAYERGDGAFLHAHGVLNVAGLNRDAHAGDGKLENEGLYEISGGNLYLTVVDPDGEAAAVGKYQYDMKVGAQGASTGSGTFRVIGADAVISSCVVGIGENAADAAANPTATGSLSNGIHIGNNGTLDFHVNSDGISAINIADGARFLVDDLGGATLSVDVAGGAALTATSSFTLIGNATPMTYASGEDHNSSTLTLSAATMVEDAASVWTIDQTGTDVTAGFSATTATLDTVVLPGTNSGAYSLTGLGDELGVSMDVSTTDLAGVLDFMADNGFDAIAGTGDYDIELTFDTTSLTDANFVFDFSDFDVTMTVDELLFTSEGGVVPIAGDANGDQKVDGSDVTILAGNWQKGVSDGLTATWEEGDFNGDGKVDGSDVTILAGNWQYGVTAASAAVPEPSTMVLVLMGLVALGLGVARRR